MSIIPIDAPIGLKKCAIWSISGKVTFFCRDNFPGRGIQGRASVVRSSKKQAVGDVFSAEADRVRYLFVNLQTNCRRKSRGRSPPLVVFRTASAPGRVRDTRRAGLFARFLQPVPIFGLEVMTAKTGRQPQYRICI